MAREALSKIVMRGALTLAATSLAAGAFVSPALAGPNELLSPNYLFYSPSAGHVIDDVDASADGRYVVFTSTATNLVSGVKVPVGQENVYFQDREGGKTRLISHAANDVLQAAGGGTAQISDDGRYIAYGARSDVAPGDKNGRPDYVRLDRTTDALVLVERTLGNAPVTKGSGATDLELSGDGRFAVFNARVDSMGGYDGGNAEFQQVYRRDILTGLTEQLSRVGKVGQSGNTGYPGVSANGSVVTWQSGVANLVGPGYTMWRKGQLSSYGGELNLSDQNGGLGGSTVAVTADGGTVLTDNHLPGTPPGVGGVYQRSVFAFDGKPGALKAGFTPPPSNYLGMKQASSIDNDPNVSVSIHARSVVVSPNGRFFATTYRPKTEQAPDWPALKDWRMDVVDRSTNKVHHIVRDVGDRAGGYVTSISNDGLVATFVSAQDDVVAGKTANFRRQAYAQILPTGWNEDPTKPACSDGKDNDGDGKADIDDPGCYENGTYVPTDDDERDTPPANVKEPVPGPTPPTVSTPAPAPTPTLTSPTPAPTPISRSGACGDGADNDGDGKVDAKDSECHVDGNANNPLSYDPTRGEGAPTDCVRLTPLAAISSISRPERVPGGQVRWQGPKRGLIMLNASNSAEFKLRFQAKGKRAGDPQRLVSSVEFSYNGKRKVVDRRGPFALTLPREEFLPGQRSVEAKVKFRSGKTKKLRSAVVARYCKPPTMLVTQNQKQARKWTGFGLRFDSGGPTTAAVTFGLPASLASRLPKAKARLGTLKLRNGSKVVRTLDLGMPAKRGNGKKLTLARNGALRVIWTRGRGSVVAVTGLPAGVTGVWATFKAKHRNPVKGTRMAYTATATDALRTTVKLTRVTRVGKK